ncbi:DUF7344 domain-containing protein [Haloterrigena alkaliphila]|uniref:DUF7344 domain-containing protein n=1 Tax=Haloterrigena alkaliphila TaxID=2816475 RepID=A0A8A2VAC0_9EURY|nr:hypothetical protein [Haloterrigena alkaliphila]QSW98989.1 hypothetical protein J0X25_16640 [Haloterrigena alkaliphila]
MSNTAPPTGQSDDRPESGGISGDDERGELDPDDIYHLLQTSRRRHVLRYLRGADDPVTLREVAERIAAWEHDTTVENLSSSQRQRVYISLYQSHLPKLDTRGIIHYDKDRGTIESTPLAAQFDPYLSGLEGASTDPWPYRYAGAVACCGLFLAAIAAGLLPVPWAAAATLVVLAVAVVAGWHAYSVLGEG